MFQAILSRMAQTLPSLVLAAVVWLWAGPGAHAQFGSPTINGSVSAGEYGTHTDGQNQQTNSVGSQVWYMTWDNTNLYVAVTNANLAQGVVLYIDRNPVRPSEGSSNTEGNRNGFNYDGAQVSSLPFRADFVAYFKDGYHEYRTANGSGGWSNATSGFGSYGSSGSVRELAIPWSAITGSGRPSSFLFLGYVVSSGGFVYGTMPQENTTGNIGLSATYNRYYSVNSTADGTSTKPFAINNTSFPNDIQFAGVYHDSFDSYYRSPFGAVAGGTSVTLRCRTSHYDVGGIQLRVYTYNGTTEVTSGVVEYSLTFDGTRLDNGATFDVWKVTLTTPSTPSILYYNFRIYDGTDQAYYGDAYNNDHDNLGQGGDGTTTDNEAQSYQLTVYDPSFVTPDWLKNANVYQIFPDRFRNGDITNDYCRSGSTTGCPSFYGSAYPDPAPSSLIHTTWNEQVCNPRDAAPCPGAYGNQFFGGDFKGIEDKLDYLRAMGMDTIYVNPIVAARSNHRYDADDFMLADAALGGQAAFDSLIAAMNRRGMKLILDGVWNHASQDSRYMDYYNRYPSATPKGACQDANSSYRSWFIFYNNDAPCDFTDYSGWFGFGGLPEFRDDNAAVRDFLYRTANNNVTQTWYQRGAAGWRFDVAIDISHNFWRDYRPYAKSYKADGPLIGELFPDATKHLLGNELDAAMNYRFRKNVLGYVRGFDWEDNDNNNGDNNKIVGLAPSQFNRAMLAVMEDYAPQTNQIMLNLIDSHDTNRALYTVTILGDTGLTQAKDRLKLAALIQFTHIGAPMVYYGDEIALNAPSLANNGSGLPEDDPYNRAPYPWADEAGNANAYGPADSAVLAYYSALGNIRKQHPALRTGSVTALLIGDITASTTDNNSYSYIRAGGNEKAVVALNNGTASNTLSIPVSSYFADGAKLRDPINNVTYTVSGGAIALTLAARSGVVLVDTLPPSITPDTSGMGGSAVTVQQASPAVSDMVATIAAQIINAPQAGFTVTATYVPAGLTVSNIQVAMDGAVTADVAASCAATVGANTVEFTVTDMNGLSNKADVTVNVTANSSPTVGSYANANVNTSGSATVTPSAAPADNGTVSSVTAAASSGFTGTLSTNAATGAVTASNAAPAGNYTITVTITDNCGATTNQNFTLMVEAPTLARVEKYEAYNLGTGNLVRWHSSVEVDNLGFNVFRMRNAECEMRNNTPDAACLDRITPDLVAGSAFLVGADAVLTAGKSYSWWDAEGRPESVYWVEDVDLKGIRTLHGPVRNAECGTRNADCRLAEELRPQSSPLLTGLTSNMAQSGNPNSAIQTPHSAFRIPHSRNPHSGRMAVKIGVNRAGWYRVTEAQLVAAGLPADANASLLQLYAEGVQVPLSVRTTSGQAAALGPNGVIEFYGQGLDTPATDTRTYWLIVGDTPGLRIGEPVRVAPRGGDAEGVASNVQSPMSNVQNSATPTLDIRLSTSDSFPYTVGRKDRTLYFAALRNGDAENFFGAVINTVAVPQMLTVRHLDATASERATVEIALQGATAAAHRVGVTLNGTELGEIAFNGQEHKTARFRVAQSALTEGENTITLQAQNPNADVSVVDYLRITYAHRYQAENDALTFLTGTRNSLTVNGFTSSDVQVFDITEPQRPFAVQGRVTPEAAGYAVTLNGRLQGRTMLALAAAQARTPVSVTANEPSDWANPSNSADFVILTHRNFRDAVAPLAAARNAQGMVTVTVTLEDVYDEWNDGAPAPQAVSAFLRWARENWQTGPRYVLLVGDASFDPRNYLGQGSFDFVPTRLVGTDFLETASDESLVDFDNDGVGELAVGRLPARMAAQAQAMVAKILAYAPNQNERGALLMADSDGGNSFVNLNQDLRAQLPAAMPVTDIRRGVQPDASTRSQILTAWNNGPALAVYAGHGSVEVLTSAGLLNSSDAANLTNNNRLPIFVSLTCLNGYFHDLTAESLAEALVKAPSGGAVAAWGSSALTVSRGQATLGREFLRSWYGNGEAMLLGDAVLRAKQATSDEAVRRTWILFGDPTLPIR